MKLARFLVNYFDSGELKFACGKHYPLTDETQAHIDRGEAELRDVNIDPARAAKRAAKAQEASDKAAGSAAQAKADAADAAAIAELAREVADQISAGVDDAPVADQAADAAPVA